MPACLRKGCIVINRVVVRFYNGVRVGDPFAPGVLIGPLTSHAQFERVHLHRAMHGGRRAARASWRDDGGCRLLRLADGVRRRTGDEHRLTRGNALAGAVHTQL